MSARDFIYGVAAGMLLESALYFAASRWPAPAADTFATPPAECPAGMEDQGRLITL